MSNLWVSKGEFSTMRNVMGRSEVDTVRKMRVPISVRLR